MIFSIAVVFLLMWLWVRLQEVGRNFAKKHPELGRYREEGGECGKTCGCANWKHCEKKRSGVGGQKSGDRGRETGDGASTTQRPNFQ